ncbi:MAG: ribbon-helix-helix protein, CopG family [Hyphomonas sp.]|nr:ribbon-helix-helix protein, CopG family [Hyphomonas sp.]
MKPRVNIRLSYEMHRKLEEMVLAPGATKSAIMEDALRAYLDPQRTAARDDILLQRLDRIEKRQNAMERDLALCLETLGQFVLYWLTRTDPIPESQRDAAQILGQRRFEFFIDQVARRVASDEPLSKRALSASAADDLND